MSFLAADHKPTHETTPDVLFPGHDDLRPPQTDALSGTTLELHEDGRPPVTFAFTGHEVSWTSEAAPNAEYPVGSAHYEAIELQGGLIGLQVDHEVAGASWFVVLDRENGRAISNHTRILSGTAKVAERTEIRQFGIGGALRNPFERSADLVGRRIQWRYSDTHLFEHLYLEPNLYAWHGITGPEAGMSSAEPSVTHRIRDGLYLFSWSEQAICFNGALVIDIGDPITSAGRLLQWDVAREQTRTVIVGATGRLLNTTTYDN